VNSIEWDSMNLLVFVHVHAFTGRPQTEWLLCTIQWWLSGNKMDTSILTPIYSVYYSFIPLCV